MPREFDTLNTLAGVKRDALYLANEALIEARRRCRAIDGDEAREVERLISMAIADLGGPA